MTDLGEAGIFVLLLTFLGSIFIAGLFVICWLIVWKKAGYTYPLVLALLMLIPIVNIVLWFIFVFGNWPLIEQMKRLNR